MKKRGMNHRLFIAAALIACATFASAQTVLSSLTVKDAKTMGLGGAFSAISQGYGSLYGNPAGFASSKGQLTLSDLSTWGYLKPTTADIAQMKVLADSSSSKPAMAKAADYLIRGNGLGAGLSLGLGYTGHGLGLGAYLVADAVASGSTLLGASLTSALEANAVFGFGLPIRIGSSTLSLGGDVRPFFRVDAVDAKGVNGWPFPLVLSALQDGDGSALMNEDVKTGVGLAMDFGAQLEMGSLSLGLSVRNVAPSYLRNQESVSALLDQLQSGSLPSYLNSADKASSLPIVCTGLAWKPVVLKGFFEPSFYMEVQDPVSIVRDKASVWNLFHAGVDLRLLSFLDLRAGLNRGWLSAGLGLDLYLFELDAAVFTEELGAHPGDEGRSGFALQAAFHI
jgi:hypothetical protein